MTLQKENVLDSENTNFEEPVFVWSHIMLPHYPLIFGPNGEPITPGTSLLTMNHPEYTDNSWDVKQQFVQQIQFANKKSIEFYSLALNSPTRAFWANLVIAMDNIMYILNFIV